MHPFPYLLLLGYLVSLLFEIFYGYSVDTLHAVVNRSSKRLFSFHFTGNYCSCSGYVDFRLPARLWGVVFLESTRAGRLSPWFSGLASVCLLPVWCHGFELIVVSLLFCMFLVEWRKVKK